MPTPNEAVFRAMFDAIFSGRLDDLPDYVADDFEIHEAGSLPYGGVYRGPDGLRDCFLKVAAAWDDFAVEMEDLGSWGDKVIFQGTVSGGRNGRSFTLPLMELWEYRDGKAVLNRPFYWDTKYIMDLCYPDRLPSVSAPSASG